MPVALVTGAAKGIGQTLALALAGAGYDVAVHYRSSAEDAEKTAQAARRKGVRAETFRADVTRPDEAQGLVKEVHETLGGPDVLINNVGNYHYGPLTELDIETWLEMFDSNLHCTFYLCRAALPLMQRTGKGRIINLGFSGAETLKARPNIVAYSVAKTGVILYSKALAKTYAKDGITVNVLSPGVMENSVAQPVKDIPLGRTGRLTELADAALFLLSDEAAYITGVTLEVAGGWNL
jgi:3-oxoacyl-[acyl-carrier protein] reductase